MRLQLVDVVRQHGSHVVLDGVSLQVNPGTRLGLVGRNGSGKSTLLRILGGLEQPDSGTIVREPATLTAGYLPQEHVFPPGESVGALLARRTGVAAADAELAGAAEAARRGADAGERYSAALDRFLALGGGDLETRAATRARRARAAGRARPRGRAALGRRGRAARAGGDPALALRRAPARRADERPRLRRARAARAVRRDDGVRPRRRLPRPGVPRPDGDAHRRDRGRARPRARVRGRLDGVRRRARRRARGAVRALRGGAGAPPGARRRCSTSAATRRGPAAAWPTGAERTR